MRISKIFVTVDAVVFKYINQNYELLLIERKNDPFKGSWALPGGFVEENEDLEAAALRELEEETGIKLQSATQLKAFGDPYRDPRHHTVAVAFMAYVDEDTAIKAGDDAADAKWFPIERLPPLAFDHSDIINFALTKLK